MTRLRLHLPHPRRTARQRRARQQRALVLAVRRAGLADRTPQTWDGFARDGRPT